MTEPRPTAAELVAAVAGFLESDVRGRLEGADAYKLRVAVNALRIVERELSAGPALAALAALIRDGQLAVDDAALRAYLVRSVQARVKIDAPGYGGVL